MLKFPHIPELRGNLPIFIINKMKNTEKLYKETNEKFVQRVENMIYNTCGCDIKRAREVLEECALNLILKEIFTYKGEK